MKEETTYKHIQKSKINSLFLITIIVNVLIPKCGIKIANIPITLGSILFLILLIHWFFNYGLNNIKKYISIEKIILFIGILFWLVRIFAGYLWGNITLGSLFGFLIPLCIYPLIYFIAFDYIKNRDQIDFLLRIILLCIVAVVIYTFMQYIFGIGNTAIPLITVNLNDYLANPSGWWLEKMNAIGSGSKMPSTYQNGNLLGVALIMWLPVLFRETQNKALKYLFSLMAILSIILAGSRSVYIGLFLLLIYAIIIFLRNNRLTLKNLIILLAIIIAFLLCIFTLIFTLNRDIINRILEIFNINSLISGTGRTEQALEYFAWLEHNPFTFFIGASGFDYSGGAYEMTYICVFVLGGIIGLFLFVYPMLVIVFPDKKAMKDHRYIASLEGVIFYLVVAFVEGGYWLPPTALNVWVLLSIISILKNISKNEFSGYLLKESFLLRYLKIKEKK